MGDQYGDRAYQAVTDYMLPQDVSKTLPLAASVVPFL